MEQKPEQEQQPVHEKVSENVQSAVEQAQQEVRRSRAPWYRVLQRTRVLASIYILQFALFTGLAWFVHTNPVLPIDILITREFQENKAPWLNWAMVTVSYLGYQPVLFTLLVLLTAAAFWLVNLRLEAVYIVALSTVSSALNGLIKLIVSRPRPTAQFVEIIQGASGQSFPSGHVMSYVAFWGLLFSLGWILFKKDRWWHYALLIIPALFVILVGPSRIYLGDHWASDVLGGYLFGGMLLGTSLWLYLWLKERGVLAPKLKPRNLGVSSVSLRQEAKK